MEISDKTFKPSLEGRFNRTSRFTVLVGTTTTLETNGFNGTIPGRYTFGLSFPKVDLTPTYPGLTTTHDDNIAKATIANTFFILVNYLTPLR